MDDPFYIHEILVPKDVGMGKAYLMAKKYLQSKHRSFFKEDDQYYRFRNIAKKNFQKKSFRTEVVDDKIALVCGKLKDVQSS